MKQLLIAVFLLVSALPVSAQSRPTILWISAEDISPDLGSYGDGYARTPNLDKLASQGVRFAKAFSAAPVCAPSRSAIITGMYATSIGSHHMRSKAVPPAGVKAFPEYLRAAGYYCTNNSKTDYNIEAPPSNTPPATVSDESSRNAHWRNRAPGQPFFAVFNLIVTHESRRSRPLEALQPGDHGEAPGALAREGLPLGIHRQLGIGSAV